MSEVSSISSSTVLHSVVSVVEDVVEIVADTAEEVLPSAVLNFVESQFTEAFTDPIAFSVKRSPGLLLLSLIGGCGPSILPSGGSGDGTVGTESQGDNTVGVSETSQVDTTVGDSTGPMVTSLAVCFQREDLGTPYPHFDSRMPDLTIGSLIAMIVFFGALKILKISNEAA